MYSAKGVQLHLLLMCLHYSCAVKLNVFLMIVQYILIVQPGFFCKCSLDCV